MAEPYALACSPTARTERDLADLADGVSRGRGRIDQGSRSVPDPAGGQRLSHRFHEPIMQRSGNKTLALAGARCLSFMVHRIHP